MNKKVNQNANLGFASTNFKYFSLYFVFFFKTMYDVKIQGALPGEP
jgi:hypothetical protein